MKDTFTIPVSFDEFVAWLNGYARRTNVLPATVMTLPDRTTATVTAHGAQIAFVLLEDADDRATLRAEFWTGAEAKPDAWLWYAEALQMIHLKWPPATDSNDLARKIAREIVREQEWKEIRRRGFIDPAWDEASAQPADEAQTAEPTPEAASQEPTMPAQHQLTHLVQRTDKGAPQWWADLDAWWTQHCDPYTWSDLAEKTGYSQPHLKAQLTPKTDAKKNRRQ